MPARDNDLVQSFKSIGYEATFPLVLDATALSDYKACPRKFFYSTLLRQVLLAANPHFVAGGAYAVGHEVFRKLYFSNKTDKLNALCSAVKALWKEYGDYEPNPDGKNSERYKTAVNMARALVTFYKEFPPENDFLVPALDAEGNPLIEYSFGVPFLNFKNPQTGDPILYAGRFDAIIHLVTGGWRGEYTDRVLGSPLYGYDDKTTYALGPTWSKQWALRSQFLGYTWATGETSHHNLKGFVIRGAAIQANEIKHVSVVNTYPSWMVAEWLETTYETVRSIISDWTNERWRKDFDSACTSYGGCSYVPLCSSPAPTRWLPSQYKLRTWNPIEVK